MKFANEDDMVIVGVAGQQRVVAFAAITFCIGDVSSDLVQQMVDALVSKPARVATWWNAKMSKLDDIMIRSKN